MSGLAGRPGRPDWPSATLGLIFNRLNLTLCFLQSTVRDLESRCIWTMKTHLYGQLMIEMPISLVRGLSRRVSGCIETLHSNVDSIGI